MSVRKPIEGWPGYEVDDVGVVWSCRNSHARLTATWHALKGRPDRDGYLSVTLKNSGTRRTVKVAHLVLEAFSGPRAAGMESCHDPDPSPSNNRADNLRWATHRSNIQDKVDQGRQARGERHGSVKLTEELVREIRAIHALGGNSYRQIGALYSVSAHQVYLIVKRRNWAHVQDVAP